MKRILTAMAVLLLTVILLNAEEEKKEVKKFPGDIGLEFGEEFHFDTIGNKSATNYGWSDVYSKTRGKFQIAFPVKFYTVTPWVQDAVELPISLGSDSAAVALNVKNDFYAGLDNTFTIDKVMTIGLNFEFRLGSCLGINPVTGLYDGLEVRLSPVVNLSGSYDFGLTWGISQYFEFYFFPDLAPNGTENLSTKNLQFTDFEGTYNLSYEFLHFIKDNDKIKANIYGELYLWARLLNEGHYVKDYFAPGNQIKNVDPAVGITFDIYGFTPFILYFTHAFGDSKANKLTGSWIGIKAGLGYTKNWFSFNMIYYGTINSDPLSKDNKWMNHIETYVKFNVL